MEPKAQMGPSHSAGGAQLGLHGDRGVGGGAGAEEEDDRELEGRVRRQPRQDRRGVLVKPGGMLLLRSALHRAGAQRGSAEARLRRLDLLARSLRRPVLRLFEAQGSFGAIHASTQRPRPIDGVDRGLPHPRGKSMDCSTIIYFTV